MIFDEIKDIIIDQLQVDESEVTMDTSRRALWTR